MTFHNGGLLLLESREELEARTEDKPQLPEISSRTLIDEELPA
jgi:hypothetical protein